MEKIVDILWQLTFGFIKVAVFLGFLLAIAITFVIFLPFIIFEKLFK